MPGCLPPGTACLVGRRRLCRRYASLCPKFLTTAAGACAFYVPPALCRYGLFKQATTGDNSTSRPGIFDPKGDQQQRQQQYSQQDT